MIHQYIFAGPKPGLSAEAFQSYWINFHAVDYAAKIPQISQYLVSSRIHVEYSREVSFYEGVAEIWLKNDEEQLASMQSPEYILGARADEPKWAAFWQTFVHESDSSDEKNDDLKEFIKFYILLKRKPGTTFDDFESTLRKNQTLLVEKLPKINGLELSFSRKKLYGFGEPKFDVIEVWSFDSSNDLNAALKSDTLKRIENNWQSLADERYIYTFCGKDNWIIPAVHKKIT